MRVSLTARYVSHPTIHFGAGRARSPPPAAGSGPNVNGLPPAPRSRAWRRRAWRCCGSRPVASASPPSAPPVGSETAAPLCRSGFSALAARSRAVAALRNARATSAGGVVHRSQRRSHRDRPRSSPPSSAVGASQGHARCRRDPRGDRAARDARGDRPARRAGGTDPRHQLRLRPRSHPRSTRRSTSSSCARLAATWRTTTTSSTRSAGSRPMRRSG